MTYIRTHREEVSIAAALIVLAGILAIAAPGYFARENLSDLLLGNVPVLVIALVKQVLAVEGRSCYTMPMASQSPAPIGDMMQIVGTWIFGSPQAGWWFMFIQALTVFLALIGTTLACMNTGARVTYAMGRDDELAGNLGVLRTKNLTPHVAVWLLAAISVIIGIFGVALYFCGGAALTDDTIKGLPHNFWYSFGLWPHDMAANIPQSLLVITLASNFGTFLLYMMTCIIAIVAFREIDIHLIGCMVTWLAMILS